MGTEPHHPRVWWHLLPARTASSHLPFFLPGFFRLSCLFEFGAATLSFLIGAACPHCPLSSRILRFVSPPGLHSSYIPSQYQRTSPLPIPPTCPYFWSWISLSCPVLSCCWSYVNWDPMVLTVKVKYSICFPLWLSYTWKRILWLRVFVDGETRKWQLSRGGLPLSSVEGSSYHPAKHWKPFREDWKQTSESQTLLSGRAISTVLTGSKPSCECSLHVAFLFKKVRRGKQ